MQFQILQRSRTGRAIGVQIDAVKTVGRTRLACLVYISVEARSTLYVAQLATRIVIRK